MPKINSGTYIDLLRGVHLYGDALPVVSDACRVGLAAWKEGESRIGVYSMEMSTV